MMGWTFEELDRQDMTRIYDGLAAANIRNALDRVRDWVDSGGRARVSRYEWTIWKQVQDLMRNG